MKVNFADTKTFNNDPIPAQTYKVIVSDGEMKEAGPNAKNPGSEYIRWELTVSEGEYQGRKVFLNTTLVEAGLSGLKSLLEATGKFDVDGDLNFEIDDVVNSEVLAVVKQKEYPVGSGDKVNEVKRIKPLGTNDGEESLLP